VRCPERFDEGDICSEPVSLVDVLPTLAAAAEVDTGGMELDGLDLAATARGETDRRGVYSQFDCGDRGIYMVVEEDWKYFYSAADDMEYLFDRATDPEETRNKAGLPFCKDTKAEIKDSLLGFLQEMGEEDAFVEEEDGLDWRTNTEANKPAVSRDPDAGLLIQDAAGSVVEIEGYE